MRNDLLFHITTRDDWKQHQRGGNYEPESFEKEGFIHCSTGSQLEDTANRLFGDEDEVLLLVIDVSMVREDLKYEKDEETGEEFPHIYAPLRISYVIDKIDIKAEDNGKFSIDFTSD